MWAGKGKGDGSWYFFPNPVGSSFGSGGGGEVKAEALHLDGMDKIVIAVLSI